MSSRRSRCLHSEGCNAESTLRLWAGVGGMFVSVQSIGGMRSGVLPSPILP